MGDHLVEEDGEKGEHCEGEFSQERAAEELGEVAEEGEEEGPVGAALGVGALVCR